VARYGGEEFVIVMPRLRHTARHLAERLRRRDARLRGSGEEGCI
jgi:PleD family two-component response regulator